MTQMQNPTLAAWLHAFTFSLSRSRFSVIVLVAGLALLLSDQGRDVLTAYAEDDKTVRVAVASAFWAFSIWGWSRLLLDVRYEELPSCMRCYNECRKWLPRLLGSSAFLVVAFSAYQANQIALVLWALGGLAIFIVLVVLRRPVQRKLASLSLFSKSSSNSLRAFAKSLETVDIGPESVPPYSNFWELVGIPGWKNLLTGEGWKLRALITLAMFFTFLVLAAMGNFAPVLLGSTTGPLILFFLWGATWLPLGSWMSYFADKRGVPLISLLIVVALISSYFNDNHEIRHAEGGAAVDSRPSVTEALDTWGEANRLEGDKASPFVVVATAGGGIRAAYWTATVLGDLHEHADGFPLRTFALSGVSGGSVGATVYRALLDVPPEQLNKVCPNMTDCTQRILGNDFLGPLTAAMLYPDLAQRFWPIPMFPDRAEALEESWESSFSGLSKEDLLNGSLGSLGGRAGAPSLFLNATWVDNGRRIVASNLRYSKENPDEAESFVRSNDELAVLGYDLRLSTAAHNSARFPFVSPPGMWSREGKIAGRLQDGGLFENYGAETALEILDLACRKFACPESDDNRKRKLQNIIPVVVLITSDPSLPKNLADSPKNLEPIRFGYEARSTFRAYERVRGGRGAEAAYRLNEWTKKNSGKFFEFRMCHTDSKTGQPPLGWALSDAAKKTINSYLHIDPNSPSKPPSCYSENSSENQKLRDLLASYKAGRGNQGGSMQKKNSGK